MVPIKATELAPVLQAFLIALSMGESENDIRDYNEFYGGGYFEDFSTFPDWEGKDNSHAAGRYQFEPSTWDEVAAACDLQDFTPKSQDIGAAYLARKRYNMKTGRELVTDLTSGFLDLVPSALRPTWTSLNNKFPFRYRAALAFVGASAGAAADSGSPAPVSVPSPAAPVAGSPAAPSVPPSAGLALAGSAGLTAAIASTIGFLGPWNWPLTAHPPTSAQLTSVAALIVFYLGYRWHVNAK